MRRPNIRRRRTREADSYQIDRAFQNLGSLYAAEHAEHDDHGAQQVDNLIRLLRKFKAHEQTERAQRAGGLTPEA